MDLNDLTKSIKEIVLNNGFHKVGIAKANSPEKSSLLESWLKRNFHGDMKWMENYKTKRMDVQELYPDAKSVISVAHNYYVPEKHTSKAQYGKISRYAWGEDYHTIMKRKLKNILREISKMDKNITGQICVDSAPAMDKLWAEKSGIGWQGKHSNIISKEYGSWIFLGELIVNIELEYDKPMQDFCGSCNACIEACPTNAIVEPYVLDARKCISYVTIEYRDKPIPYELQNKLENWIFGCDICQDVCPWNKFQKMTSEDKYFPRSENLNPNLKDLENISREIFKKRYKKTPIYRTGWKNFIRNVSAVLKKDYA